MDSTQGVTADPAPARPPRGRWPRRFSLKILMVLPIVAAAALLAIDWWTAIPAQYAPTAFRVIDAETGRPIGGAAFTMIDGDRETTLSTLDQGLITYHGGTGSTSGHVSLLRDTRRPDHGKLRLRVAAPGYDPIDAPASDFAAAAGTYRAPASGTPHFDVPVPLRRSVPVAATPR